MIVVLDSVNKTQVRFKSTEVAQYPGGPWSAEGATRDIPLGTATLERAEWERMGRPNELHIADPSVEGAYSVTLHANPIIDAFLHDLLDPSEEDGDIRDAWLHYIDEGLIGFEYTPADAAQAKRFIESKGREL